MSESRENVLLFGLGGIGGIYASILSLSKAVNVHVVARSNYESVKERGFKLVSQKFGDHDITFDGGEFLFQAEYIYYVWEIGFLQRTGRIMIGTLAPQPVLCIGLTYSLEEL